MCYMRGWKYKCGHVFIDKTVVHRCPSSAQNVFPNPHCYRHPGVMYPKKNPLQEKNCPECEEKGEKRCAEEQTTASRRTSILSTADDEEIAQASSPNEHQDDDDDDDDDQNCGGDERTSGGVMTGEDVGIERPAPAPAPAPIIIMDDTADETSTWTHVVQPPAPPTSTATADDAEPLDGDEGEVIALEQTDTADDNPSRTLPPDEPKKRSLFDPRGLFGL